MLLKLSKCDFYCIKVSITGGIFFVKMRLGLWLNRSEPMTVGKRITPPTTALCVCVVVD